MGEADPGGAWSCCGSSSARGAVNPNVTVTTTAAVQAALIDRSINMLSIELIRSS
jgi:hypothetical protein